MLDHTACVSFENSHTKASIQINVNRTPAPTMNGGQITRIHRGLPAFVSFRDRIDGSTATIEIPLWHTQRNFLIKQQESGQRKVEVSRCTGLVLPVTAADILILDAGEVTRTLMIN
jgi:hypothetical protein